MNSVAVSQNPHQQRQNKSSNDGYDPEGINPLSGPIAPSVPPSQFLVADHEIDYQLNGMRGQSCSAGRRILLVGMATRKQIDGSRRNPAKRLRLSSFAARLKPCPPLKMVAAWWDRPPGRSPAKQTRRSVPLRARASSGNLLFSSLVAPTTAMSNSLENPDFRRGRASAPSRGALWARLGPKGNPADQRR